LLRWPDLEKHEQSRLPRGGHQSHTLNFASSGPRSTPPRVRERRRALRAQRFQQDDEFAVEDHIRPTPPSGYEYDPRSRDSCVGTWSDVKGHKLVANVDAKGTLVVDLVQIRTGLDKFKTEGRRVAACNDLATAPAEPIESRLSRVR
jgi:hypothetical protein